MDTQTFQAALERDGYEPVEISWPAGTVNETHTHPFSARALCLAGEITIETADGKTTCRSGDTFELAAEVAHAEYVGEAGVELIVGRLRT